MKSVMLLPISLGLGLVVVFFGVYSPPIDKQLSPDYFALGIVFDVENCVVKRGDAIIEYKIAKKVNDEWIILLDEVNRTCSLDGTGNMFTIQRVYEDGVVESVNQKVDSTFKTLTKFRNTNQEFEEIALADVFYGVTLPNQISGKMK